MTKPDRNTLVELCLVRRLTEGQIAEEFGVHRNTVARWKQEYDIQSRDWWRYQVVKCVLCGTELDPNVELDAASRKRLINSKRPMCDTCKENYKREYNRQKQAEWRDKNRENYNEYMRQWRKENKQRWLEIKRASAKRRKYGASNTEDNN